MLTLKTPAKLNLFLHILGRRTDGYHNIQTVFQFIDLCDTLSFEHDDAIQLEVQGAALGIGVQDNLVYRAAQLLKQQAQYSGGARITLEKQIPAGGGLGGGSSDAAATLLGLNTLWSLGLALPALEALGATLGADVPIFLRGQAAWAEGIGTELTPMTDLKEPWYVLAVPDVRVSTPALYQDPGLPRSTPPITRQTYRFGQGHNDFQDLVCQRYSAVRAAQDWLAQFGPPRLTGSGGVVFLAIDTEAEARKIQARAPVALEVIVVRGCNQWGVAKR